MKPQQAKNGSNYSNQCGQDYTMTHEVEHGKNLGLNYLNQDDQ